MIEVNTKKIDSHVYELKFVTMSQPVIAAERSEAAHYS